MHSSHTHIHSQPQREMPHTHSSRISVLNHFIITTGGLSPVHCTFWATLSFACTHTDTHTHTVLPVSLNHWTGHTISLHLTSATSFTLWKVQFFHWVDPKDSHLLANICFFENRTGKRKKKHWPSPFPFWTRGSIKILKVSVSPFRSLIFQMRKIWAKNKQSSV